MAEQPQERWETDQVSPAESSPESPRAQGNHGSLSVEDDPDGTPNPADLADSATADDATVGYQPAVSEADEA